MQKPYGDKAGGHTMGFRYDSHGTELVLNSGCTACHSETAAAFTTKSNNARAALDAKLATLKLELIRMGIYDPATGLAKVGTYSADVAGAFWNYKVAVGDGDSAEGLYAHNPPYTNALIQNSIDKLQTLPTPPVK